MPATALAAVLIVLMRIVADCAIHARLDALGKALLDTLQYFFPNMSSCRNDLWTDQVLLVRRVGAPRRSWFTQSPQRRQGQKHHLSSDRDWTQGLEGQLSATLGSQTKTLLLRMGKAITVFWRGARAAAIMGGWRLTKRDISRFFLELTGFFPRIDRIFSGEALNPFFGAQDEGFLKFRSR